MVVPSVLARARPKILYLPNGQFTVTKANQQIISAPKII